MAGVFSKLGRGLLRDIPRKRHINRPFADAATQSICSDRRRRHGNMAERMPAHSTDRRAPRRLPIVDLVVEVAGHAALTEFSECALEQDSDLVVASAGALAHEEL